MGGGDATGIFKVILVGDSGVGKTSILRKLVKGVFLERYQATVGAEFTEKDIPMPSPRPTARLMVWDTSGKDIFTSLTQAYYKDSSAAIIVFSTSDRDSFLHVEKWKERVEEVCGDVNFVMCQTKIDLADDPAVEKEEAEQAATRLSMPLFRTSPKDNFNVSELFAFAAEQCYSAEENAAKDRTGSGNSSRSPTPPVGGGNAAPQRSLSSMSRDKNQGGARRGSSGGGGKKLAAPFLVGDAGDRGSGKKTLPKKAKKKCGTQ